MLGLEWKDIDFETGVVHIQRTSNYTKAKGIYTDTTKTENSVRFIKLPPEVLVILEQFRAEQESEKQRLCDKWVENDRLFVKWNGMPMNPQTPYGWLKEFCEKNDLPFYGLHSFRHFAASALISAGLDVTTVSGALRHSNSTTTVNLPKGHTPQSSHNSIKSRPFSSRLFQYLKHIIVDFYSSIDAKE
ncbi:MAG: site-specific integrase [Oscillospiraceae bacterium]